MANRYVNLIFTPTTLFVTITNSIYRNIYKQYKAQNPVMNN